MRRKRKQPTHVLITAEGRVPDSPLLFLRVTPPGRTSWVKPRASATAFEPAAAEERLQTGVAPPFGYDIRIADVPP